MSSKISALPTVASVLNADLLTGVQAGANYKTTRPQLLAAAAGEPIEISGQGSSVAIDNAGNVTITIAPTYGFQIDLGLGIAFNLAGTGDLTIAPGGKIDIFGAVGGSVIGIDGAGVVGMTSAGGVSCLVGYKAAVPGQWAGSSPVDLATAVDRLAGAVYLLRGSSPIP